MRFRYRDSSRQARGARPAQVGPGLPHVHRNLSDPCPLVGREPPLPPAAVAEGPHPPGRRAAQLETNTPTVTGMTTDGLASVSSRLYLALPSLPWRLVIHLCPGPPSRRARRSVLHSRCHRRRWSHTRPGPRGSPAHNSLPWSNTLEQQQHYEY